MHHTSTTLITELEHMNEPQSNQQIDRLAELKNDILKKMELIDSLNITFKQKSEMSFLKTFQRIMNELSQQLKNAVEAYQNIDQEIQTDPKCVLLTKQALFYKHQRQALELNCNQQLARLNQVKMKNMQLKHKRNQLRAKSVLSQQKLLKYSDKNKTLSFRFEQLVENFNNTTQTNHKKVTQSTKYHTSADKTRIPSFNSVNKKTFFDNIELEDEKAHQKKNYSLSKKKLKKLLTTQNVTPFRINNFF